MLRVDPHIDLKALLSALRSPYIVNWARNVVRPFPHSLVISRATWHCGNPQTQLCCQTTRLTRSTERLVSLQASSTLYQQTVQHLETQSHPHHTWRVSTSLAVQRESVALLCVQLRGSLEFFLWNSQFNT